MMPEGNQNNPPNCTILLKKWETTDVAVCCRYECHVLIGRCPEMIYSLFTD
jgi:hypothetical protein